MSHLSTTLQRLMTERGVNQSRISEKTGMLSSQLSRICSGKQVFISDEDLRKMALAITDDLYEQAELTAARMMDICTGPGAEMIELSIKKKKGAKAKTKAYSTKLDDEARRVIEFFEDQIMKNPRVRQTLVGLMLALTPPKEEGNFRTD